MNFAEVKEMLPTPTPEKRAELLDHLGALQEGVSLEEFRAIRGLATDKNSGRRLLLQSVR